MNQRHAQPSSNGNRRQHQGQGKAARPGVHRRVHSYHNTHSQTQSSGSKITTAAAKKAAREEVRQSDDEDGMAGLPQFCTTCERQIINPGNSTLYCSRACQRRDSAKPTPTEPILSPAFISAPSYFDIPQPDILPQRSPTVYRPVSLTFSDLYLSDSADHPTEDEDENAAERRRSRGLDDATRYYGHSEHDDSGLSLNASSSRRPHTNRASTSTLPSLSHTPSSSVGTAASFSGSLNYHPNPHRPLPSRHEGHRFMKSADLVIPTFAEPSSVDEDANASVKSAASTLTSFHAAESVTYGKQAQWGSPTTARGSLKQLFGHEAMASTPKPKGSGWGSGVK